jgi:lysozyme
VRRRRWWVLAGIACLGGCVFLLGTEQRRERLRELVFAPSHSNYPIRGIDVSHHQGSIDWARVKASGYTFAFIKASEGADFRDTRFSDNWAQANTAGLITGAYHFFTFCASGVLQADHFLAVVSEREHALPLGVDVELTGNCKAWDSVQDIHAELRAFVERVEAVRREKMLLYTELDQFEALVPAPLHRHSLWLRSLWGEPDLPLPWLFWQYSDSGDVPGIRGPVDLDVFAGDRAAWRELVAAPPPR